ncbi:Ku protein [Aureimonas leprariae]|uniref:Non-homologous end joining protein Ku n=1 Tax=Plantimonas leprariae TaxID=2615207 RepID=A0A7V7PMC9_9HYPH|nr:Ku protein [Aureimonas leprariae]KAB0678064.1 Ku protein [Aureimonas leprariae]
MPARPTWKGYLKLSLVSCAVGLYPATTSTARVAFHTINKATGNRVKRQFIDAESGEVVDKDEQAKGFEVGKGSFVVVEDKELDAIKIESTHTISIESFVPREQVDERYLDAPYYLAPEDKVAQEAFAVIRNAMQEKGKAGVARIVLSNRERMVLLDPHGKGVLATVLRYPYEIRPDEAFFENLPDVELPREMRELAVHIIDKKAGDFDPTAFEDRYEQAVLDLVASKQKGKAPKVGKVRENSSNVVSLMDALKKSIAAEGGKGGATKTGGKSAASKKQSASSAPAKSKRSAKASTPKKTEAPLRKAS